MKEIFALFLIVTLVTGISSCKKEKCFVCTRTCATCVQFDGAQSYSKCASAAELNIAKAACNKSCVQMVSGSSTDIMCQAEYESYGIGSWENYLTSLQINGISYTEKKGTWTETPSTLEICDESTITQLNGDGYTCVNK